MSYCTRCGSKLVCPSCDGRPCNKVERAFEPVPVHDVHATPAATAQVIPLVWLGQGDQEEKFDADYFLKGKRHEE